MATINNVTIEDFKMRFKTLPYLPLYVSGKAYFKGDEVYVQPNFYTSLTNQNTSAPPENWELTNDSINNYISDSDIEEAFNEAKINFNPNLFSTDEKAQIPFLYLAAHYLVVDLDAAQNPFTMGGTGFTRSKSVGSVSESYEIPKWILDNPRLSFYAQTKFGCKYLSLIQPYLIGNIIYTPGKTVF